ncbi:MAG: DUF4190 domain-containing protein [Verrucomicrobiota bacterium]|nr:DUF4190 domain-containing protein [Verrucomicrobiota bacterium]
MTNDSPAQAPSSALSHTGEDIVSALPIWTVAFGVFSLLTLGLTSVPAVICGHLALAQSKKRGAGLLEKRATLVGLFIGYLGAILLAAVIAAVMHHQP